MNLIDRILTKQPLIDCYNAACKKVDKPLFNHVWDKIRDEVKIRIWDQVGEQIGGQIAKHYDNNKK